MAKTPKGRALGNALRQAREDHGLTMRQFAARIGRDAGILSRWEAGSRAPKPEQVAQLLTALEVRGDRYDEILALAYAPEEPSWVATTLSAQRHQFAALLDFEQRAVKITDVAPLLIPGLLRTEHYVDAILRGDGLAAEELASRLSDRSERAKILTAHSSVRLVALIGQAALCHMVGSPAVMAHQLRELIQATRRPNVEIQVIPFHAGWHPGMDGSFEFIECAYEKPVVAVENRRSGLFLHEGSDVRAYQRAIDKVEKVTLSREESIRVIASLADRMERAG